jgi:hypothetical protein
MIRVNIYYINSPITKEYIDNEVLKVHKHSENEYKD